MEALDMFTLLVLFFVLTAGVLMALLLVILTSD
jgi:hypothetical protein